MAPRTSKSGVSKKESEIAITMEAITRIIQELANAPQAQQSRSIRQSIEFDKFYRLQPPAFLGGTDPLVAEEWILEMEKRFEYFECSEEDKVHCATFMLRKDAWLWWLFTRRTVNVHENPIGWEQFKNLFLDSYFPETLRNDKRREFIQLEQGDLTLVEYEREFEQLSRFAPHLVDTDEKKIERFKQGLRPELGIHLAAFKLNTYSEVVKRAQIAAYYEEMHEADESTDQQSNYESHWQLEGNGKRGFERNEDNSGSFYSDNKKARVCGGSVENHVGYCSERSYACYFCGVKGHKVRECPVKNGRST